MKKFLSIILSLAMIFAMSATAFAADSSSAYSFSGNIVYAEVTDGEIQSYTKNNIIVMTEAQALELGSELQDIATNCERVYIIGDINPVKIANAAGLPAPGQAVNVDNDNTVKNIAVAIDSADGQLYIEEIAVKSENLNALLNSKSANITMNGIKAALVDDSVAEVTTDEVQPYSLPSGYDKYSNKSTTVYDNDNNNIGTMRFNARYYDRGSWTSGYMFDTIVKATFAPTSDYEVRKVFVTLGHTSTSKADHEIIDETYIPSSGSQTTYELGLDASADGVGVGVGASWSYSSEAMDVTNSFSANDKRVWTFEPVDPTLGNALSQEPGIRSVSESSSDKYTTIILSCPFYNILGMVLEENFLSWNILW